MLLSIYFLFLAVFLHTEGFNRIPPTSYQSLTLHATGHDELSNFLSKKNFADVGMSETIQSVTKSLNLERPSKIQALSYRPLMEGKTCIVADQTGSGKTLAYLLPVLQRIFDSTTRAAIGLAPSRSPYILIVTPTTELATQVSKVVKSVSNVLKYRTACLVSIGDADTEQKKLRVGAEVVIATPGRLAAAMTKGEIFLNQVKTTVLDEADVLFMDQSFPLEPIGSACPSDTQFVFVTATLPAVVTEQIMSEFTDVQLLSGPGLHRISPMVEEVLIDCSGAAAQEKNPETAFENKRLALLRSLEQTTAERTIVFCNTISQCRKVENALQRVDRQARLRSVFPYHGAVDNEARAAAMKEFSRPLLKLPSVLVCTDRASRGMDFDRAQIDHVILFDFPQEPSEYVRRVGRTGRAGRHGKVTVLVHGRQVPIAKQVLGASIDGKKIVPELSSQQESKPKRPSSTE